MAKQSQEKGKGMDVTVLALCACSIVMIMWMFWFVGHNFITLVYLRSRQYELKLIGWVLHFFVENNTPAVFADFYSKSPTVNLTFGSLVQVLKESGYYTRWLFAPPIIVIGIFLYRHAPTAKFKKSYTIDSLARQEAQLWPEIYPVIGKELVKGDITKGSWRVSQTEWEFARSNNLVRKTDTSNQEIFQLPGAVRLSYVPEMTDEVEEQSDPVDDNAARKKFIKQLGPRWRGPLALPSHIKGIYAALATRVVALELADVKQIGDAIEKSNSLFRKMAKDYYDVNGDIKKMDFTWANEVISKLKDEPILKMLESRHAYVYTLMSTLLHISRRNGVVASSMFTWVKPIDRSLWYMLNNVGGYTYFSECAGIAAHWLTERSVGEALIYPSVDEAIHGLNLALQQYIEEDHYEKIFK